LTSLLHKCHSKSKDMKSYVCFESKRFFILHLCFKSVWNI